MDRVTQMSCLGTVLDRTTLRQLGHIVVAMLTMSGRVTRLGLSRWTDKGGSYRTLQRFFHRSLPWGQVLWLFFRQVLWRANQTYLLVGDETVVAKAGKQTHGLDRFYASLYGRPMQGLAFFALALVSVEQQRAYRILVEQRQRSADEKQAAATKRKGQQSQKKPSSAPSEKRARARPKGSLNKDLTQIVWTAELRLVAQMLQRLLVLVGRSLPLQYLVLDGHFGHNNALQMVRQSAGLHLLSKLRQDAALYLPAEPRACGRGRQAKYGAKLNYTQLPAPYLQHCTVADGLQTQLYQVQVWHKACAQALNGVILLKTNLTTTAQAHVVLFSSDLALSADQVLLYYRLRFQIEFNLRAAKQFWGLEDFMTVKPTSVLNAATLSLFMVNVSQALLDRLHLTQPTAGLVDLKAYFRGRAYACRTLKLLPQPPEPFLFERILTEVARLGCVHPTQSVASAA